MVRIVSTMEEVVGSPNEATASRSWTWAGVNFAGAILVSAFLLFQVQPLISKFILPWFGGSPGVWTTCMLFFQVLLFGGYAYAHLTERWLKPASQAKLHLGLLVAAAMLLPIIPKPEWKPSGSEEPTWCILGLLALTVGLPYFVLSSTGPLVQAWFCRSFPGRSPYRLYSLSNVGSLAALLSYPFVFEPALDLPEQAWWWSAGFAVFVALCAGCAACLWRLPAQASGDSSPSITALPMIGDHDTPCLTHRALWLLLPACASLLLLATTNHVCQDVAVIPFLWVAPLSLYLLSFIISFDHERWYLRRFFSAATVGLVLLSLAMGPMSEWAESMGLKLTFVHDLVLHLATLFVACMVCHGELVRLRPASRHLTEFYLLIAAGGALGGIFVSLIAPHVFTTFIEWRIGLVASFVVALGAWTAATAPGARFPKLAGGASIGLGLVALNAVIFSQPVDEPPIASARNFYGLVRVWNDDEPDYPGPCRMMVSGHITHGRQFVEPDKRALPLAYYGPGTGINQAVTHCAQRPGMRMGVIGLGVGTMATFAAPGQSVTFYEINPEVERLAREYFWFLTECRGKVDVVLGDGRLSLERQEPQNFDMFVLDAFSSDAIPMHLLTSEAMAIYVRHLAEDGIIAVNVTNTHLDIEPVVQALADHYGLDTTIIQTEDNPATLAHRADWMLLTRDREFLVANPTRRRAGAAEPRKLPLWTDHDSNLFQILK
ncbi:MAG TPA: fused MFS/spermidine synthase [Pirellulales bacterium]|nr:fused MFS/spermidine synthase [Pirellulales bacterium]